MEKRKKVVLAMSGGVDSSVSLALLIGAGFEVKGVHFRIKKKSFREDEKMVLEVAKKFGVEVKIIDKRKDFEESVVSYFLEGYKKGITPNPCVFCNKNFKFKWLLGEMKKEKADAVATGHYARLRREFPISNFQPACRRGRFPNKSKEQALRGGGHFVLFEAIDKTKDQSYFLYTLNQKELSRIIFPL
ncbi:MAG: phosphoadenosine phosphosulfate reductase family protein, partial [Patescibacteria group bacterium]